MPLWPPVTKRLRNTVLGLILAGFAVSSVAAKSETPEEPAQNAAQASQPLPIEVEAEQGIEWLRNSKVVYARGNARAVRGDLVVTADVLGAHYRDLPDGGQEVWQLDASGNVKITSPGQTAVGDTGTYDLDTGVLLLYGKPSRMTTGDDSISADHELEYATKTNVITARGNAAAKQGDRLIKAEEIIAFLGQQPDGGSKLERLEAERNVSVITPKEVIRGDRGVYNVTAGTATVTGDVKITRGPNQLDGCRGELDLKAGVSRLKACAGDNRPVRGLILPGAAGETRGATTR